MFIQMLARIDTDTIANGHVKTRQLTNTGNVERAGVDHQRGDGTEIQDL
jgi:hypothetical protein